MNTAESTSKPTSQPKYVRLADTLRKQISDRNWGPGKQLPTQRELVDQFDVSITTVANAMRLLTEEGLVTRKPRVGTVVADPRKRLVRNGSWSIYLLVHGASDVLHNPWTWFISDSIVRAVLNHNHSHNIRIPQPGELAEAVRADPSPTAFLCQHGPSEVERNVIDRSPWVALHTIAEASAPFNCVNYDSVTSTYQGLCHVIEKLGHREVAMVWGGLDAHRDCLAGYRLALQQHGIPFRADMVANSHGGGDREGAKAVDQLLDRKLSFSALYVDTDLKAIGAMQRLRERGVRVPQDVSVIGCDNIAGVSAEYALATIERPFSKMAVTAYGLLEERIRLRNRDVASVVVYGNLIERDSCAPFERQGQRRH